MRVLPRFCCSLLFCSLLSPEGRVKNFFSMRYSVFLEPVNEPEFQGYYYAHVPALDLTTHGNGVDGALAAAKELIEAWIAEKKAHGEPVPTEAKSQIAHVEIPDALFRP